ncbi:hypothetical protein ERJ75_000616400 [Trypanosoma vivax]|nr:hypothetical protein ERJ75_000616400 [Trypanosoma vivax]
MRQPRTQVLRSDAKAVSTRVAEGNLALTTEEREEARGPRDLAKLDRARPASCWTNGQTRRASRGRRQSKHARLLSRRAARRKRGRQAARATYGKGAGAAREGNYWEAGARKSDVGRAGGQASRGAGPRSLGGDARHRTGQ